MLFSIVIPTHDRLSLLRDAVETIRRQQGGDWELAIFDNASSDPIGEYVRSLNDPRVRYERSDVFLPVTESWNNALRMARGEYVILLGDDDGLAPGALAKLRSVIVEFGRPEVIYSALYQFIHPGVAPWRPSGYVSDLRNGFFFVGRQAPFRLSRKDACHAVNGSLSFRRNFTFNMQAFAFAKSFLGKLAANGPVFQSPFPDYYLANVAFARSESTVVVPEPLAIAGVSKASFGFTLFNGLEEKGASLLNTKLAADPIYREVEPRLLPGAAYILSYVVTMEHVARALAGQVACSVDYARYRRLQILNALQGRQVGAPIGRYWDTIKSRLAPLERIWAEAAKVALYAGKRSSLIKRGVVDPWAKRVAPYSFDPIQVIRDEGSFSRAIELFDALESGTLSSDLAASKIA